jgi:hypothetical protein
MAKEAKAAKQRHTKLDMVRALLMRPEGANLADICSATGWQMHSARAVLSGLRKSGHIIERIPNAEGSVYRITSAPKAKA